MTDREPQVGTPTAPQQSQPQRPQQTGSNGASPAGGPAQGRGGATPGTHGQNGAGRAPAPRAPRADDPPTQQIPAVRADAAGPATADPAKKSSTSAESGAPDRTQAIPVVREPLREKAPATTTADAPSTTDTAPSADEADVPVKESAGDRRRRKRELAAAEAAEADDDQVSTRKARLRLVRLDPWSVMKTAFALSISLAIVTIVAVTLVWAVLDLAGVWDAINSSVATILSDNADAFDVTDYVGFGRIIGFTLLIAAVNVVLLTALATIGAFLYNLSASLLGGLEVTLAEDN